MTEFPTKKGMTLRRFAHKMHFVCTCCDGSKYSKFRADTPDGVICNRCYGRKLQGAPPVKEAEAPLVLSGTVTGRTASGKLPVLQIKFNRTPPQMGLRGCKRLHLTSGKCGKEFGCESG